MKKSITKFPALAIVQNPQLEKYFRYLCAQPVLRKYLKLGLIAFGCLHLDHPEIRLAELHDYKMYVNIAEPLGISSYFFQGDGTVWITSDLISAGDVCFDIGANMGHYTFYMASKVGEKGKVFAFEPQPNYFKMIDDSIKLNDHIENYSNFVAVDNRALWSISNQTLKFFISENPNNSGTSSLLNHGVYVSEHKAIEVQTITLDDYLQAANIKKIKLIKIDVEGADPQVLQGASNLLSHHLVDYIIIETTLVGSSLQILEDHGYKCFYIDLDLKLIDIKNDNLETIKELEKYYNSDYLAVSPNCLEQLTEILRR